MIGTIQQFITDFLNKFWAPPGGGGGGVPWSLEYIIRCESTHFLFSLFMGWLVASLIWTIYSSNKYKGYAQYTWSIGLLWGLFASVTTHIFIDSFSNLA